MVEGKLHKYEWEREGDHQWKVRVRERLSVMVRERESDHLWEKREKEVDRDCQKGYRKSEKKQLIVSDKF